LFAYLLITSDLFRHQAPDVVVLVYAKRVATDQEPLALLFRFFTHLATACDSSVRQLRNLGGGHSPGNNSSLKYSTTFGQ